MYKYNLYNILFENNTIPLTINNKDSEELYYFKDEWYPTLNDWFSMINNLNKHANLFNIFNRIIDVNKLIRCYLAAKFIDWPGIEDFYNENIYLVLLHNNLKFSEIDIIENENIEIPEEVNDLIENLSEYDKLGGIALRNQDLGEFVDDKNIFNALSDLNDIESCTFLRLPLDYNKVINNIRIIKLNFINGSLAYIKINKLGKNSYHLKTADYDNRNIKGDMLKTKIYIYLYSYIDNKKVDTDYTVNWL